MADWRGSTQPQQSSGGWGQPAPSSGGYAPQPASSGPPSTTAGGQPVYQGNTSSAPQLGTAGSGPAGGGGLLGPVYSGLGMIGLDPGQGNQQLAAGMNNIARQAQQSGNQQLQYMQGALGASEGYFNPAMGQYNALFAPGGSMTTPGYGEQAYQNVGGSIMQTNPIQAYQQQMAGQFQQPGAMEQFANSTLSGNNPYYNMMSSQMGKSIDSSFNAGGNYNSGARLAAQALGQSNLAAQTFNNEANIMGQGQAAQQARLAGGGSLANMSAQSGQNAYEDYLNQALAAQGASQNRQTAGFTDALGMGSAQGQMAAGMYTDANKAYADMLSGAFKAEGDAYGAQANAQKDRQGFEMNLIGGALGL